MCPDSLSLQTNARETVAAQLRVLACHGCDVLVDRGILDWIEHAGAPLQSLDEEAFNAAQRLKGDAIIYLVPFCDSRIGFDELCKRIGIPLKTDWPNLAWTSASESSLRVMTKRDLHTYSDNSTVLSINQANIVPMIRMVDIAGYLLCRYTKARNDGDFSAPEEFILDGRRNSGAVSLPDGLIVFGYNQEGLYVHKFKHWYPATYGDRGAKPGDSATEQELD